MKKIIHLIPNDGLGGVEQAARSLNITNQSEIDIKIVFLSGTSIVNKPYIKAFSNIKELNSLKFYLNGLRYLRREKPDIVISSLWRSSIISIFYSVYRKFFYKKAFKLIIFIHANKFAHILDRIITTIAIKFADEVWCDSLASKKFISISIPSKKNVKHISFLVNPTNTNINNLKDKRNNFVFWGRLAKQKRVDKAIHLFKRIQKKLPESIFYIYGPDCGELESLISLVQELGLENNIKFMGSKKPDYYPKQITSSKFFINTSTHEGMAIAVTEAMQLGLVPIVTEVGEIANYCTDNVNSIYYRNDTLKRVLKVIEDESQYEWLSSNAFNYWKKKTSYSEDFIKNCLRLSDKK